MVSIGRSLPLLSQKLVQQIKNGNTLTLQTCHQCGASNQPICPQPVTHHWSSPNWRRLSIRDISSLISWHGYSAFQSTSLSWKKSSLLTCQRTNSTWLSLQRGTNGLRGSYSTLIFAKKQPASLGYYGWSQTQVYIPSVSMVWPKILLMPGAELASLWITRLPSALSLPHNQRCSSGNATWLTLQAKKRRSAENGCNYNKCVSCYVCSREASCIQMFYWAGISQWSNTRPAPWDTKLDWTSKNNLGHISNIYRYIYNYMCLYNLTSKTKRLRYGANST